MLTTNRSRRLLLPVRYGYVLFTLLVALVLNIMPVGRFYAMPDFVALVLALWCVREPMHVSLGTAFLLGCIIDVAHGSAMGQHALAYVILAHVGNAYSRRLMWFAPGEQALHMMPVFLLLQVLMMVVRLLAGGRFPGWEYFFSSFTTALLWIPVHYLLIWPQLRPIDRDENRPL